jgi:SAM-dependent methyltransferase
VTESSGEPLLARGYFDEMTSEGGSLFVAGWLLNPRYGCTEIEAAVNGRLVATQPPQPREDVARTLPWIAHAARSGFRFALKEVQTGDRIELRARRDGRLVGRMGSVLRVDLDRATPTPPPELMRRVAGPVGPGFFKADGLRCFTDFVDTVGRYRPLGSFRRMLDWGCGCGRISVFFLLAGGAPELHGCDIDAAAVTWCREHLEGGTFRVVDPYPPTPYESGFFDLVVAYSVFTHLRREDQRLWLKEMRRLIAPGGFLLASIHGRFAASFRFRPPSPRTLIDRLRFMASGFFDSGEDPALRGIAPEAYYRGVYQSRGYTLREWSEDFEILDLLEGGMANHQDLVVMRRREA